MVGDTPKKPGRPWHSYHSAWMATTRLTLAVDVLPGNETAPYAQHAGDMGVARCLAEEARSAVLRNDVAYGSKSVLCKAENPRPPYLNKLRLTKNVKDLITMFFRSNEWKETGPGWEGVVNTLRLDPDTACHCAAPGTHG